MVESGDPAHRTRTLALTVLGGTLALLVLLIAVPLVVPHESLPEPIIVFVSIFILISALIAGIALAYLFLTRAPVEQPNPRIAPLQAATPAQGHAEGQADLAYQDLAIRLLDGDERRMMKVIVEAKGSILQRDLVRITAFSEAKVSRLLDRLEERGLVRRERQGMSNRIRLTLDQA